MIKVLEEILCSLNYAPPNAPASRENAPVSVKSGVVLHSLSDYGKTTNEDCDLLRFALFCKKCSTTGVIKLKNISPQNVPKHGIFGHFEKGINYDKNTFRVPRHSSFMIMHTFADWGRVRHNMAKSLGITTV